MGESQRDAGLVRALTSWGLAASIINTVVGAGIFTIPAALAAAVGAYAPLAILLCAVGIVSITVCFAEGGSRIPTSGGAYGYIEAAMGPLAGYVAGTMLWFSDVLAVAAVAGAFADVIVSLFPKTWTAALHPTAILIVIGGIALVNTRGASRSARLVEGITFLKLIPLAVFIIAGATAIHRSNLVPVAGSTPTGFGRAVILALFAFTGMEVPLSASGEVARPAKIIPRALILAMLPITLLYLAIQVVAQGILGSSLARSAVPLADAMAAIHPALRLLMLAGAAVSMFGYIASDMLGTPRMLFAFARDGLLPRVLGRLHSRTQAPHIAILSYAAVAMAVAISGSFAELAVLATLSVTPLYILGCASAWRLARRGVALAGEPLNFKWLSYAMAIGISSMLLLIALGSGGEILGLLALIAISASIYLVVKRGRTHDPPSPPN